MVDIVAENLCNKDKSISCDECYSTNRKEICKKSNRCRISEKTDEQLAYILSSVNEKIFLNACPGSGKTEVVGMKAAYEINKWCPENRGGIAFLSFTNYAVEVINERVNEFSVSKGKYPHFIGTLSSFIFGYIAQPFGYIVTNYEGNNADFSHRIVDSSVKSFGNGWLENYKCRMPRVNQVGSQVPIYSNQIEYDNAKEDFVLPLTQYKSIFFKELYEKDYYQDYINDIRRKNNKPWMFKYDYCLKCFREDKERFLKGGFANFTDLNQIALNVLRTNHELSKVISKRFPLIIVDECQDLSLTELLILYRLKETGTILHFVGDLNQSVYEFKRVNPEYIQGFVKGFKEMHLSSNFRSCNHIVEVMEKIIPSKNGITPCGEDKLEDRSRVYIEYSDLNDLLTIYKSVLQQCNISTDAAVVLVKQNSLRKKLNNITNKDERHLLLEAIRHWRTDNIEAKKIALEKCGKQLSKWFSGTRNSLNYYCPDDIKTKFYWRIFLRNVLDDCINGPIGVTEGLKYSKWYKTVRENLPNIVRTRYALIKDYDDITRNFDTIFSGNWYNAKDAQMDIVTETVGESPIYDVMTIHSSKGCTFDSTLVVSSVDGNSQSGHWRKHWIDGEGENCRVGYVALSRAKYQVVLAVPKFSGDDLSVLADMGFRNYKDVLDV